MTVKLIVLKSGENIISDVKEGFYEDKLVCYLLENPCLISVNGTYKVINNDESSNQISISLHPWPQFSGQTTVELVHDWIITIVDPQDELKKMYQNQVITPEENKNEETISISKQHDLDIKN